MALKTKKFDIQEHLTTQEERLAYLAAAFEEGDDAFIKQALNDISRSVGMADLAKEAGVTREGLYKSLSDKGDPKLSTLMGLINALEVKLTVALPESSEPSSPARKMAAAKRPAAKRPAAKKPKVAAPAVKAASKKPVAPALRNKASIKKRGTSNSRKRASA